MRRAPYCRCHTDVAYHDKGIRHQASEAKIAHAYRFLGLACAILRPRHTRASGACMRLNSHVQEKYYNGLKHRETTTDPVEQARQWYVGAMMSMKSSIRRAGWSCTKGPGSSLARARGHTAQRDHRAFERALQIYDSPAACLYLDPLYLPEARRKRYIYHQEMSLDDQQRLLASLAQVQGMVMLPGAAHPLYQEALTAWQCLHLAMRCSSAMCSLSTQASSPEPKDWTRTECIWLNPACTQQQPMPFRDVTNESEVRA